MLGLGIWSFECILCSLQAHLSFCIIWFIGWWIWFWDHHTHTRVYRWRLLTQECWNSRLLQYSYFSRTLWLEYTFDLFYLVLILVLIVIVFLFWNLGSLVICVLCLIFILPSACLRTSKTLSLGVFVNLDFYCFNPFYFVLILLVYYCLSSIFVCFIGFY